MGQVASKTVVAVVLVLVLTAGMRAVNRRQLARLSKATPAQIAAHQRSLLSHSVEHDLLVQTVAIGFVVGFVEALSWCVRWPFVAWSRRNSLPGFPVEYLGSASRDEVGSAVSSRTTHD